MYGQFNGTATFGGFPAMQNRMSNTDNQFSGQQFPQYARQQMPSYLKGRMVTSVDEAKASQFDLDGTITFFPSLAENKIYAKTLDNNGLPVFLQFVMVQEQPKPMADNSMLDSLVKRIEKIEKELGYEPDGINAGPTK